MLMRLNLLNPRSDRFNWLGASWQVKGIAGPVTKSDRLTMPLLGPPSSSLTTLQYTSVSAAIPAMYGKKGQQSRGTYRGFVALLATYCRTALSRCPIAYGEAPRSIGRNVLVVGQHGVAGCCSQSTVPAQPLPSLDDDPKSMVMNEYWENPSSHLAPPGSLVPGSEHANKWAGTNVHHET
eukprot:gene20782-biopygen6941